jgi:CDP-glucose 4,6-dehydratase
MEIKMFNNTYSGKKILITGHTGFKGTWLSIWLKTLGAKLYGISREVLTEPSFYENTLHEKNFEREYFFDISNFERFNAVISEVKPDFIFHLAAQALVSVSYENPIDTISTNVFGTVNLLESLRKCNYNCVAVIITSDKVYKNIEITEGYKETDIIGGHDIYSGSKGAADILINSYFKTYFESNSKVKIVSARAGNVIGGGDWSRDRLIVDCIKAWRNNKDVILRSPYSTRPWQHVMEPLSGYLLLGDLASRDFFLGEPFNFGPNESSVITVKDLINKLGLKWFKKETKPFFKIQDSTLKEANLLQLDCKKALKELKWKSIIDINNLVDLTVDWYKNFYDGNNVEELTNKQILFYYELARSNDLLWTK